MNDLFFRSLFSAAEQASSTGGMSPLVILFIVILVIILIWFLLRSQTAQVDQPDHAHEDDHAHAGHEVHAEAAPAEAAPAPEPATGPDNLNVLEGVGPKVESVLNAAGFATFSQVADASTDALQELLDAAGYRYMNPASWPDQARLAAAGDWDALKALQDELNAGRSK